MKWTENKKTYANAVMDTPFGAVCVKRRGKELMELVNDKYGHGLMVVPKLTQDVMRQTNAQSQEEANQYLYWIVSDLPGMDVMVRGHGWDFEKKFVWTGTKHEFQQTWEID